MKTISFTLFLTLICSVSFGQNKETDSLMYQLSIVKHDTSRVLIMVGLAEKYRLMKPDTAMEYGQKALYWQKKSNY